MWRGIIGLTGASAFSRVVSALSVILLAIWLSPAEFGYWAAASSTTALVLSLVNFGEINGYLSGQADSFHATRLTVLRVNLGLASLTLGIAAIYALLGNTEVAILCVLIAASVPFVGDADLLYSAGTKHTQYHSVLASQVLGACVKLGIGVVLAWVTGSAIAIAIATLAYYVVIDVFLAATVPKLANRLEVGEGLRPTRADRLKWAVNSFFLILPIQAAFVVAQFLSTPELLGVFYLAFQASLAVSGVIAVPISRVALASFARTESSQRLADASLFVLLFSAGLLLLAPIVGLLAPIAIPLISAQWAGAFPAAVILLASVPLRIAGPILDAYQQSEHRWWQSTTFNAVDTALTAGAAVAALTQNVLVLATAISLAKILLSTARTCWIFAPDLGFWHALGLVAPAAVGAVLVIAGVLIGYPWSYGLYTAAIALAGAWLVWGVRRFRAR